MIYPLFEEFKEMSKKHKMAAVTMEMQGDMETPITLYKKLCKENNSYLLESVENGEKWGRYSYIGRNPYLIVKSLGNQVEIFNNNKIIKKNENVMETIKDLMDEYKTSEINSLPDFSGGAVGYFGYDTIRYFEKLENINHDDIKMPDVHLIFTKEVIVYDHIKQKIIIIVNTLVTKDIEKVYKKAVERLNEIKKEILESDSNRKEAKKEIIKKSKYISNETKEEFIQKVIKAKEYIKNGDIIQVVLSQRLQISTGIDSFEAYRILRGINPSPYMFYLDLEGYKIVGSSPELLVKLKDDIVETCPIAGTRPRGMNKEQDDKYAEELLKDEKELAEHLMLVDLSRNDVGKISQFGTVEVKKFMEVQKYSHVMHIVSYVTGKITKGLDMFDVMKSCIPAGTVSGAPKVRAMEIIDELENAKRGIYAGGVGYLGFNGNMDMCIAIRTMIFKDKKAYIQAGAGIVADSNPESEYDETLRKASALLQTIKEAEEGIS